MEYRQLGASGFRVPVLCLGTGTFGGRGEFFGAWGASDVADATRLVDICLTAGLTMFDSADGYSGGAAEEILGQAIRGRREQVILSTKGTFRSGPGPNDVGSSRHHLIQAVEGSLRYRVPLTISADGNTVDLAEEQMAFAENAVAYSATLSFLQGRADTIKRALKGE